MNQNYTIETLHNLRSIRQFEEKPIAKKDLQSILSASICAANSSGRQNYAVIVVEDKELLKQFFYGSAIGLLFCVDYNRIIDTAKHTNNDFEVFDIRALISGIIDTTLVIQNAVVAAKSLGIDSLITNSIHRASFDFVYETFNLPKEYCFPVAALCLGYSTQEPKFKRGRLTDTGIIHYGKYSRLQKDELDALVAKYNDETNRLGSVSKERLQEMGYENFLDWFFQVWSKRPFPQPIENFYDALRTAGFLTDK